VIIPASFAIAVVVFLLGHLLGRFLDRHKYLDDDD